MSHSPTLSTMQGKAPKVLIAPVAPATPIVQEEAKSNVVMLHPKLDTIPEVKEVAPISNPEAEKYKKLWDLDAYRKYAPGERAAHQFLTLAAPRQRSTVIDFGAGTGRGGLYLATIGAMHVTFVDFAENCLDPEIKQALDTQKHMLRFVLADLEKPIPVSAKYGFCTDVMEHIPTDKVDVVLHNILKAAEHVFFQISCQDDHFGSVINETLHLTVKSFQWWKEKLLFHGATIHWSEDKGVECSFFCSSWANVSEIVKFGELNTGEEVVKSNISSCIARKLPQVRPYTIQADTTITVLGGGPSLKEHWDEIYDKYMAGQKVVTTNGTYNECLARNIFPSAQIVVDAREFNLRFVSPVAPNCKFLLASQCHPSVFDAVPAEQIHVWHTPVSDAMYDFVSEEIQKVGEVWYPVVGGSTVMLRGIALLAMLGFRKMEIYGFDSCLGPNDTHHAYEQKENDHEGIILVTCGGKTFRCHPWMASQAQEFLDQMRHSGLLNEVELAIHGDGLIAHIIQTGADLALEES